MSACPACASGVPQAARFCSACGAAVGDRLETPTGNLPLSLELGQWYSMPAKVALAMVVVLAGYGLSMSLNRVTTAAAHRVGS